MGVIDMLKVIQQLKTGGWRLWLRLLLANVISGGATTVLSALGLSGAKAVGFKVIELDFNSIVVLFVSGAITGLFTYLKQSPLPNTKN